MAKNRQDLADKLTDVLLTEMYGEEYSQIDNLEDEEYFNYLWEHFNDKFYGELKLFYGDEDWC